jgi:hypothetical protein
MAQFARLAASGRQGIEEPHLDVNGHLSRKYVQKEAKFNATGGGPVISSSAGEGWPLSALQQFPPD